MGIARLRPKMAKILFFIPVTTENEFVKDTRYTLLLQLSNGLLSVAFQFSFGAENLTKLSSRDGI